MLSKRSLLLLVAVGVCSLIVVGLGTYAAAGLARFHRIESRRSTIVYAAPQELRRGVHVGLVGLSRTLARLGYRETESRPATPGQFHRDADGWEIFLHAVSGPEPLVVTDADEAFPTISPDGKLLAYAASTHGGDWRVFLRQFPSGEGQREVDRHR